MIFLMAFSFFLDFPKGEAVISKYRLFKAFFLYMLRPFLEGGAERLHGSKLLINFSGSVWTFSGVIGVWGQSTVKTF